MGLSISSWVVRETARDTQVRKTISDRRPLYSIFYKLLEVGSIQPNIWPRFGCTVAPGAGLVSQEYQRINLAYDSRVVAGGRLHN